MIFDSFPHITIHPTHLIPSLQGPLQDVLLSQKGGKESDSNEQDSYYQLNRRKLRQHSFRCKMQDTRNSQWWYRPKAPGLGLPPSPRSSVKSKAQAVALTQDSAFGLCFPAEHKMKEKKKIISEHFHFPSCLALPACPTTACAPRAEPFGTTSSSTSVMVILKTAGR